MSEADRDLVAALGSARLQPYLLSADGDHRASLAWYSWNADLSAAFWKDLGYLEVLLRNALDRRMQQRHAARNLPGDWLEDLSGELGRNADGPGRHRQPYRDIDTAMGRVRYNGKAASRDQTISETSFGLWHQLVSSRQRNLWPALAGAFPHAPSRSHTNVAPRVEQLRSLRNRIAHHHRIVLLDLAARQEDILTLIRYMNPDHADWVERQSDIGRLLAVRP